MAQAKQYIITDERRKPRKDLPDLVKFKDYDIIIVDENARRQSSDNFTENIPIDEIFINRELFQNRKKEYSEESVNRIIESVKNGTFNIKVFDPILLWRSPSDRLLYILSGHSRTEAFRRLSKTDLYFETIPAKILDIDEDTAVNIARNSNTLSTKESDFERAFYYQNLRPKTPENKIFEEVRKNEGKEANKIYKYSFLAPEGMAMNALRQLEISDVSSRAIVQSVSAWLGEARKKFKMLRESHENELFRYMATGGGYGQGAGQINNENDFIKKVAYLVERQGAFFDAEKPLNINNLKSKSDFMTDYETKVNVIERDLSQAKKTLEQKRIEYQKQVQAGKATSEEMNRGLSVYNDYINYFVKQLLTVKQEYGKYLDAERSQTALFGLGKPYMRLEFDENIQMLEFAKSYKAEKEKRAKEMKIKSTRERTRNTQKYYPARLDGVDLYHLYPKADGKMTDYGDAGLPETLKLISEIVLNSAESINPLANELKGKNLNETCFNIWHFIKENIRYEKDKPGYEEIRTPARLLLDGYGDCDDMTVFSSACLLSLHYIPFFYVVAFNGKSDPGHIYTGVQNLLIDGVMPVYGKHPEYITKTIIYTLDNKQRTFYDSPEKIQNMPILQALHGIEDTNQYQSITRYSLLGIDEHEFSKYNILLKLSGADRELIADIMPGVAGIDDEGSFYMYTPELAGLADEIVQYYQNRELNGLGELGRLKDRFKKAVKAVAKLTKDATKLAVKSITVPTKYAIKSVTAPIKTAVKIAKDPRHAGKIIKTEIRKTTAEIKKDSKAVVKDVVSVAKQVSEFVKQSTFAPMRIAYLGLLKLNVFKHATRLYYGYLTPEVAETKGLELGEHKKAVEARKKFEIFWVKIGGDIETLKSTVEHGRGAKVAERNLNGLGSAIAVGGGTTLAASILAAAKGFFKNIDFKKLVAKAVDVFDRKSEDMPDIDPNNLPKNPLPENKNNYLLYGGIGIAAITAIYFLVK